METRLILKSSVRLMTALLLTVTLIGLTACSEKDNPVEPNNVPVERIIGKWYAENNTPGTINVDGISIDYRKAVQYADFRDDVSGFWSIIFVDEENDAIDIPDHFCGGTFKYIINGNTIAIQMTSSSIPIMEDSWKVTYNNGIISVNASVLPNSLTPISPISDADCQRWLRQLGFGYADGLMLSEAKATHQGMVVCAEGHLHNAKSPVPEGCTAVGILGKVTKTGHGLIIALWDTRVELTWEAINGWKSVTNYASTTLKLLPDNAYNGSDQTGYTTLGGTKVSNWCVAQKKDYDAIFKNLGSEKYNNNGYTFDNNVNAYIRRGVGGKPLDGYYWSATEYNPGYGWAFNEYMWYYTSKTTGNIIRPVLGF